MPARTDELVRSEASESFESFGEVVGVEEGGQVFLELIMGLVKIGADSSLLDGAVHALDLTVGPRVIGFGEPMIDVMAGTGGFEGMGAKDFHALPSKADIRRG